METKLLEGLGALTKSGNAYLSEGFVSIADTVRVRAAGKGCCGSLTLFAFDKAGEQFEIKTQELAFDGESFTVKYEFDPASLAVYRGADSFKVELRSQCELTVTEFSVCEEMTEPSEEWADSLNALTTTEDGKPGVYVTTVDGGRIVVPRVPKKVLFIGNSLVFGMCGGKYGMCASAPDKDYFHYVSTYIKKFSPDCVFTKLYGSYLEHSENMEMFDDWYYRDAMKQFTVEDNFISAEDMLDPELDLVILQMGDNVNTDEKMETFKKAIFLFIERIKGRCPNARIIFVHSWYGIWKTGSTIKRACEEWNIERVNISCLHTLDTEAREQKTFLGSDGEQHPVSERWISHPGDLGMKRIAERIIDRLALEG